MFLAFDTETTGLNCNKNNLLTACFIILDENLIEIDRLNINVNHSEYTVSIKAMEVNKIDLIKHHYNADDMESARKSLLNFLKKHTSIFIPIGHNVTFDINFIKGSGLLTENEYQKFISYNSIDTISIAQYLKLTGDLPKKQSISLINLCKYYGIESKSGSGSGLYHTAEYDIEMTLNLLRKFKSMNIKLMDDFKVNKKRRIN